MFGVPLFCFAWFALHYHYLPILQLQLPPVPIPVPVQVPVPISVPSPSTPTSLPHLPPRPPSFLPVHPPSYIPLRLSTFSLPATSLPPGQGRQISPIASGKHHIISKGLTHVISAAPTSTSNRLEKSDTPEWFPPPVPCFFLPTQHRKECSPVVAGMTAGAAWIVNGMTAGAA